MRDYLYTKRLILHLLLVGSCCFGGTRCFVAMEQIVAQDAIEQGSETSSEFESIERRAEKLIRQLGDSDFQTRDDAEVELQKIGSVVRHTLEQATEDPDPEIAGRVANILSSLPPPILHSTMRLAIQSGSPKSLLLSNILNPRRFQQQKSRKMKKLKPRNGSSTKPSQMDQEESQ